MELDLLRVENELLRKVVESYDKLAEINNNIQKMHEQLVEGLEAELKSLKHELSKSTAANMQFQEVFDRRTDTIMEWAHENDILRIDNAQLKDEIRFLRVFARKY